MSAQDQQNSDRIVRNIDYLQVLKNRWKEVFLVFLLVLVISVVVTSLMPPSYRATSQFQIKLPKPVMDIGRGGGRGCHFQRDGQLHSHAVFRADFRRSA